MQRTCGCDKCPPDSSPPMRVPKAGRPLPSVAGVRPYFAPKSVVRAVSIDLTYDPVIVYFDPLGGNSLFLFLLK
jgi:hypothetical protein